ncbi:MAG: OmpA family protein [Bacteroidia bacterium]|nr:OmpA family protein [Bacteroidia bacterium]
MKKLILSVFFLCSLSLGVAQDFVIDTVYFEFDQHQLKPEYKTRLDSLMGYFTAYPSYFIQIFGHTDSVGSESYNLELSRERARTVALYFNDQGIDLKRVEYEGLGTTKPAASNLSYDGRRKNRRADVAVVVSREVVAPVIELADKDTAQTAEPVEMAPVVIVDTIYCDYNPFLVNPDHKTVIIAPEGTKVIIPPNAFETEEEELTVEVNELFYRSDMILNEMPTMSKDGPIEAAGMFYFDVKANRRAVKLKPGVKFEAELPSTRRDPNMAVYQGSGGNRSNAKKPKVVKGEDGGTVGFTAVNTWSKISKEEVQYKGRDKTYTFDIPEPGRYAIGRPLYYSQNTDPEDNGLDIFIKLKGRRYDKTTSVMIVGEVNKTYIPAKRKDIRNYEARKVKWVDDKTKLILIAIQYDDRGNPWIAKRKFEPGQLIEETKKDRKRKRKTLPSIKISVKFRKLDKERLEELITELNA